MRITVDRYDIKIAPDNKQDEAYIEEVLGMKEGNSTCKCVRENASGLSCIAYIRVSKQDKPLSKPVTAEQVREAVCKWRIENSKEGKLVDDFLIKELGLE